MPPISLSPANDPRTRAWAALSGALGGGPASLGEVVARIEAAVAEIADDFPTSAFLQEMARQGRIRLLIRHDRWTVQYPEVNSSGGPWCRLRRWLRSAG